MLERGIKYDHSLMHHDHQPYYVRVGDSWTKIDYAKKPSAWMTPLKRGKETDLIEIPASWYLDDLPPMTFMKKAPNSHGFVNPPVHRGSTVLSPSCEARRENAKQRFGRVMTYGTQGGPTNWTLEDVISEIEGGTHTTIVGTGLAAVAAPLMAWLKAGDRCLMPDSVYGPCLLYTSPSPRD